MGIIKHIIEARFRTTKVLVFKVFYNLTGEKHMNLSRKTALIEKARLTYTYNEWTGQITGKRGMIKGCDNLGYISCSLKLEEGQVSIRGHVIAWMLVYGEYPDMIDHIDGNRANNRISNLRLANRAQNGQNSKPQQNKSSQYKGVWKVEQKWRAGIVVNGKRVHLGYFTREKDAARAYNHMALLSFGEFAYLNVV